MIQKSLIFHEDKTNEIRLQLSVFLDFRELYQTRRQPQRRRPSKQKNCSSKQREWINHQLPRSANNVNVDIFTCLARHKLEER